MYKLSRILGIIGSAISLLESLFFTIIFTHAAFPPALSNSPANFLISNGFTIGILLMFFLACGLAASINVCKTPVMSGAAMIVLGTVIFIFGCIFIPGAPFLSRMPLLILVAAGALALLGYFVFKKPPCKDEP